MFCAPVMRLLRDARPGRGCVGSALNVFVCVCACACVCVCVQNVNALVLGTTHRYKSKYITTVIYKPIRRPKKTPPSE